jgi:hypothetical protein
LYAGAWISQERNIAMMIPVKIECGCGQHYAFDHDSDNGQLAYAAIACPTCGGDGTPTANDIIAQSLRPAPPMAAAPRVRIHMPTPGGASPAPVSASAVAVATAPVATRRPVTTVGALNPEQAKIEARAKIFWGESADDAIRHMMINGVGHAEAKELVDAMMKERSQSLRVIGIKKVVFGSLLMCVPLVAWGIFSHIGFIPIKLFALAAAVGLFGAYTVLKGVIMLVCPKLEGGDVSEQDQMM